MKITALTCTAGRPQAMALCKRYLDRQTRPVDQWLVLDDPVMPMPDKVLRAIQSGQVKGDALIFFEDDDHYASTWVEWCEKHLNQFDLVGEGYALYAQIRWRWLSQCGNARHASLCSTAITSDLFEPLCNVIQAYDKPYSPFFDTRLWCLEVSKYLKLPKDEERLVVGIKGMPGVAGYSGEHRQINSSNTTWDPLLVNLRRMIGDDADNYAEFGRESGEEILRLAGASDRIQEVNAASNQTVEVHILSHDNEQMLEWSLRHYSTFASKIVVHDGGPLHHSSVIAIEYGAKPVEWETEGTLNDALAMKLKNECWRGTKADWVICADGDELIYFPEGAFSTLRSYERMGAAVIRPHGFEMLHDQWLDPTKTRGQLYDHVKMGARDDKWYAKPILFRPSMVGDNAFGLGAHDTRIALHDGRHLYVGKDWPRAVPPTFLLHCHHIGGLQRIARRYDETRARLAKINVEHNWGNVHDSGMVHAVKKRDLILPRLERVIV